MRNDPHWPEIAQRRARYSLCYSSIIVCHSIFHVCRKVKVLSKYKFYLAFENAAIDDYVSEKVRYFVWININSGLPDAPLQVFEALIAGSVPIYRGTDSISSFLPAGSYVNANGMSPPDLAKLVYSVAKDEALYNKSFAFKKEPIPEHFVKMASMSYSHPNALCRLCDHYAAKYPA